MISFLLYSSSFFNFCFFIFAIGFLIALILEQIVKGTDNERNIFIVTTNRKYLWRQTWIVNLSWFVCNILLGIVSRNSQTVAPIDSFWDGL
ncbi:hypothetical protein AVU42_gp211 [Prochlorococcus phage P-TIM68]|uniref:Uncharacterized protein n=1 Tax=Prochlorococcus phage P-TIM68 TaxID=1542477 RepID=A0A0K0KW17_9CAUD|nr:hypothetical protein AVU42_gp211 [Prochlorococcus phage P-TIM68]AIR93548.1 hypothetical protein [Prochlorococcus phage P-TIM68]|tara:strand:- start:733 stop:1005 length:273 start_codon:yes stop_codon:yes gene_type:complete